MQLLSLFFRRRLQLLYTDVRLASIDRSLNRRRQVVCVLVGVLYALPGCGVVGVMHLSWTGGHDRSRTRPWSATDPAMIGHDRS